MTDAVSALLWRDTASFGWRAVKASSTVAAVRRIVDRRAPFDAAKRFARLHDAFQSLPEAVRADVHREPYFYFWARIAFELLGTVLGRWATPPLARAHYAAQGIDDPERALAAHLTGFGRFVVAGHLLAERPYTLAEPLEVALPFALPATRVCIGGSERTAIVGVCGGTLRLTTSPGDSAEVDTCPTLRIDDAAVRLQPQSYNLAGLHYFRPAAVVGLEYQRQHRTEVAAALALVRKHQPRSVDHFQRIIRVLALKPPLRGSKRDNVSHSDLPGSILMSMLPRPHHLADVCIHETHHNRLFAIEDREPLLADAAVPLDEAPRYYSPWQDDGRPLHGILHGLYVIIPTTRFWLAVHGDGDVDEETRAMAIDRAVRSLLQLRIAEHQVARHGRLTGFGRLVFEELRRQVDAVEQEVTAAGLSPSAPAVHCDVDGSIQPVRLTPGSTPSSIRDAVWHHLEHSSLRDQADDIRAHVAL